ncbi:MAG: post-transcriptional regulator [Sporolactobacillus sp.]
MADVQDEFEKWRSVIAPFISSKLNEFHLLGLQSLNSDDFWQFVKDTMAAKKGEKPERIHEVVAHLMSLSVNDYMNKLRMDMFRDTSSGLDALFNSKQD